jgi:CheY-like chemotaxis protein
MSDRDGDGRIRVLIASGDARFVEVTRAVLERGGLLVDVAERPADASAAAERARSDVVLVDATSASLMIAPLMSALERLERPVGVVVVSENARAPRLDSFHPSPRWGSAQRLIAQVHEAYVGSDRNGGACLAVL